MTNLMTAKEVCHLLGISRWTLYRLIESGDIPVIHVGRNLRFDTIEIRQYIEMCK